LLVLVAGADVMRLAPPLNISAKDIDEGLVLLERAVATMLADHAAPQ